MDRVKDKVAIITGGAGGIGAVTALLFAREGAKVVVADVDESEGKKIVVEIRGSGREALFVRHDVTRESDWSEVMKETLAHFQRLDVLINNAGVRLTKKIEDTSLDEWHWIMGINADCGQGDSWAKHLEPMGPVPTLDIAPERLTGA